MTLLAIRTLLVIDAERFSQHPDAELPSLHVEIRRVVTRACQLSGIGEAWESVALLQGTGDGLFALLSLDAAASLIYPFTDRLQDVLADAAPSLRTRSLLLRLRVALHTGLVDDEDPITGGISTATNDVHRLLDCEPLRAALRDSDPNVTFATVIISAEMFKMFVQGGRTSLQPSQFTRVKAKVKQFDQPAYLYVPVPSKRIQPDPRQDATPQTSPTAPASRPSIGRVSVTGNDAQNIIGNQVSGDIRQERP